MSNQGNLFDKSMRAEFWLKLHSGETTHCPCCDRHAQIYKRQLHSTCGVQLIKCYNEGGYGGNYVHARSLLLPGLTGISDLGKAKYWDLIEAMPHEPDANKSSGMWQLTKKGIDFVQKRISIPKYAIVYNDDVIRFEGDPVTIRDVLSEKFDYQKLMAA